MKGTLEDGEKVCGRDGRATAAEDGGATPTDAVKTA